MPAADALSRYLPAFQSTYGRSGADINLENANHERLRRVAADLENPGLNTVITLPGSWDGFWGGMDRAKQNAEAEGMNFRADLSGIGRPESTMPAPSPVASLRRSAGTPLDVEDDALDFQTRRAALDRQLNDNFYTKYQQRSALNSLDRAADPGIQDYEEQQVREKAAKDQEARDTIAIDSHMRLEPLVRDVDREARERAAGMLPYDKSVIGAQLREQGIYDTNNAKRDVAQTAANARLGSSAMSSLARAAGAEAVLGAPDAAQNVGEIADQIRPNVPGADAGLKPLPPEWDFNRVLEKFNGNEKAADEWLRQYGYRRAK